MKTTIYGNGIYKEFKNKSELLEFALNESIKRRGAIYLKDRPTITDIINDLEGIGYRKEEN